MNPVDTLLKGTIIMFWLIVKLLLTLFTVFLIPLYWRAYGPQNFLWLSDIGLFLTVLALWTQSPLYMSMAAVGVLALELVWNIDFFLGFFLHVPIIGLADYMFDHKQYSRLLRGISLFHVFMPIIWILYLVEYGYDPRALYYFTLLYWIILTITYCYTLPKENINWVFYPQQHGIKNISPNVWLAVLAIGFPLLIFLPTHYLCLVLFKAA